MAKITFIGGNDFGKKLEELALKANSGRFGAAIHRAVAKAAGIVADEVRKELDKLKTQKAIYLAKGLKLYDVQEYEMEDLEQSLGITPIKADLSGYIHAKVGFDGYGSLPTEEFPQGTPIPMTAASIERGSSVREKHPFIRPAVNRVRAEAIRVMDESISEEIAEIFDKYGPNGMTPWDE